MARMDKEEIARRDGMMYALKIAKEKGIEGLEEEIKFRNISQVPIAISRNKIDECILNIKLNTIDTMLILSASTLRDEFGFGKERLARFIERFNLKTDCLVEDYCTWSDQIQMLADECGIELSIRHNDKNIRL
jgi:hypothetical protein